VTSQQGGHQPPSPLQAGHQPAPEPVASHPSKIQTVSKQRSTDGFSAVFSNQEITATALNTAISPAINCVVSPDITAAVTPPVVPQAIINASTTQSSVTPAVTTASVAVTNVQVKAAAIDETKPVISAEPVKPPRPDDFDDYWYQDDDGSWKNEYTDQGYEFAEDDEFYSEEELKKAEDDMKKERRVSGNLQAAKPMNNIVASLKDPRSGKSASKAEKIAPADYEEGWYQDYDGNWYNEYDDMEGEEAATESLDSTRESSVVASLQGTPKGRKESSGSSFDRGELAAPGLQLRERLRQNPKDRWQWAFTKIVQVSIYSYKSFIGLKSVVIRFQFMLFNFSHDQGCILTKVYGKVII
jgi:hypothetical protein